MVKGELIEVEAIVKAALPNAMFRLELEISDKRHEIIGHILESPEGIPKP